MTHTRRLVAFLFVAVGWLVTTGPDVLAAKADAAFSVASVAVDVTAADAEAARASALADGQQRAFRQLLERLVPEADHGRLPLLADPVVTELVRGFEVFGERVGPDRYIASLTYHFNPAEVGNLLRNLDIPYAATASEPIVVVPLFQDAKGLMLWDDGNPWREAWASLPPSNSLVPIIIPFGELADLEILDAAQARDGDSERFVRLAERYGAGEAVAIDAIIDGQGTQGALAVSVLVRRVVSGAVEVRGGTYSAAALEPLAAVLLKAAAATRAQLENEWKQTHLLRFDLVTRLAIDIPITGFDDWLDIRARLDKLALVSKLEIAALSPRFARAVLHYLGDEQQLAAALARDNMVLSREANLWILHRRGFESDQPEPVIIE
jgi:hypothetical protein